MKTTATAGREKGCEGNIGAWSLLNNALPALTKHLSHGATALSPRKTIVEEDAIVYHD